MDIDNVTICEDIKKTLESDVIFTKSDFKVIKNTCIDLFKEYVDNNVLSLSNACFDKELTSYIYDNMKVSLSDVYNNTNRQVMKKKLKKIIKKTTKYSWKKIIPYRSYKDSFIRNITSKNYFLNLKNKVEYLRNIPQPQQRTDEWYQFRHNLLTASSIWKILGTQASINNIIYEKCKPFTLFKNPSLDSPLHWGQKYEPVSIELYEHLYNTKIEDFGCIKHPKYPFIGASPDGINVDENNPRYARMLEIKNVVNREINGIPKMEYWIQMQVQMETCDLNECDFLETQFLEYHNYEDFMSDGTFTMTEDNKQKGIMLLFNNDGNTFYQYAPINIDEEQYKIWEDNMFKKHTNSEWIRTIYWKLEKLSNILVLRNKLWFRQALPKFKDVWDTILKERITGYEHRAPKKRSSNLVNNMPNKCLINVTKLQ
jgi:putative phage-type endonuclease